MYEEISEMNTKYSCYSNTGDIALESFIYIYKVFAIYDMCVGDYD